MTKPSWGRLLAAAILTLCFTGETVSRADDISPNSAAGTIALISGKAWIRRGDIFIPSPDEELMQRPAARFSDLTARELGPNDHIAPGDIVVTGDDSYLKIYYKDDSIMDVGPNTTFKVSQFAMGAIARQIVFTLLQGKLRTLVTRSLAFGSIYRVVTPTSSMGVHGTEWVTNSYFQKGLYRTDITVLEGRVAVDVLKPALRSAKPQTEVVWVSPGRTFSGVGGGGSVSKFSVFKLPQKQVQELIAMVPNIETKRIGALATGTSVGSQSGPAEALDFGKATRGIAANPVTLPASTDVTFQPTIDAAVATELPASR